MCDIERLTFENMTKLINDGMRNSEIIETTVENITYVLKNPILFEKLFGHIHKYIINFNANLEIIKTLAEFNSSQLYKFVINNQLLVPKRKKTCLCQNVFNKHYKETYCNSLICMLDMYKITKNAEILKYCKNIIRHLDIKHELIKRNDKLFQSLLKLDIIHVQEDYCTIL